MVWQQVLVLIVFCLPVAAASALLESRAEGKISVEGRGEAMLMDFRPDSVRGWKISKARLYLYVVSGERLPRIPVSTITVRWTEESPHEAGGGVFGKGGSREANCPAKELPQGWIELELPGTFIEAMSAGRAFGLAWISGAMRINGRAPVFRQPYLLVEGDPVN